MMHRKPAPQKILIVDDDPGMREMIHASLAPLGYRLFCAESARKAIGIFQRESVDVVLLDIFMPEQDGLEAMMDLRRLSPDARIIAMSGGGLLRLEQVLRWAQALGATHTLTKPFTPREVRDLVEKAVESPPPDTEWAQAA